jgi:flagellar basal-body rod protein FlgB
MINNLFTSIDMIHRGVSAAWSRNAVLRNNIANVETPGFKASDVEFESLLARALQEQGGFVAARTHPGHRHFGSGVPVDINSVVPRLVQNRDLSMRIDGNNVDIEAENVKLAQNSLYYNTLIERINSELKRLRMAITDLS